MLTRFMGLLVAALVLGLIAYLALVQGALAPSGTTIGAMAPDPPANGPITPGAKPIAAVPADSVAAPIQKPIAPSIPSPAGLVIPVAGISVAQLADTYSDTRGSERAHEAMDIMAPTGTPVLAVADGHIEKLFDSDRGGLTIYQFEPSGRYCYYYAHLQRYAPGIEQGKTVRRGEVIAYVGATGNADPTAPHLHFAVFLLGPERAWSRGTAVNPYPLLGGVESMQK